LLFRSLIDKDMLVASYNIVRELIVAFDAATVRLWSRFGLRLFVSYFGEVCRLKALEHFFIVYW
jgi:hypothetical protein